MCGVPLWAFHGLFTGSCACGLAIPLLFLDGKNAVLFVIIAVTSVSMASMLLSYYVFGRFTNALLEELQRMQSPEEIPLYTRQMIHRLLPLCLVRESRVFLKHLGYTLERIHARIATQKSPLQFQGPTGKGALSQVPLPTHQPRKESDTGEEVYTEDDRSMHSCEMRSCGGDCEIQPHILEPQPEEVPSIAPFRRPNRFEWDVPNICLYMERSKNANLVVYEGLLERDGSVRSGANGPLDAYWLDIDPLNQAAARKAGKQDDRSELIYIEKKMAYGVSTKPIPDHPGVYTVNFVAMSKRTFDLRIHELTGLPIIIGSISGRECILEKIYIQSIEKRFALPGIEFIDMHGYDLKTYEPVTEHIIP